MKTHSCAWSRPPPPLPDGPQFVRLEIVMERLAERRFRHLDERVADQSAHIGLSV